ncbi:MAG: glycosyltransferase [Candidatus Bathyarchaeota archaeon]|nr:glycosyltransferase [Candidatus Bathyarchaeota archaeon]
MTDKVDLVMWTKNGEFCLPQVLKCIDNVIPHENICHKIIVDDHSTDRTTEIAADFNWDVYPNPQGGIPSGANEALRHVDREFFVSIEQDIILSKTWWSKIPQYMRDPSVGCAQGIRVPTQDVLRLLDDWQFEVLGRKRLLSSMDNNIFRTTVVRYLGGFPVICPVCADTILMKRMLSQTCYKWVIDDTVVSLHVRTGLKSSVEHLYKQINLCSRTPYCADNTKPPLALVARIFLTSPFRALQVALKQNCPNIIWAYPLLRLYHLSTSLRQQSNSSS